MVPEEPFSLVWADEKKSGGLTCLVLARSPPHVFLFRGDISRSKTKGAYLESNAQEIQDPHRQPPALVKDVRDLALVRR